MVNYELKEKEAAYSDIETAMQLSPDEPTPYRIRALFKLVDLKFREAHADFSLAKKIEKAKKKAEKKAAKEAKKISK